MSNKDLGGHWAGDLRFICPRCRHEIDLRPEVTITKCYLCGFEVKRVGAVYSFVADSERTGWQEFFDRRSQLADARSSAGSDYRFAKQQQLLVRAFRHICADELADSKILDLGCGNGSFSRALWPDRNLVGVDYSMGMCQLAHSTALRVFNADVLALPFADEQFDLIYCAEVLPCIADLSKASGELARVCRRGGRIVVSTSERSSLLRQAARLVRKVLPHPLTPTNARVIMRSAHEIALAFAPRLAVCGTCWIHFPSDWLYCVSGTHHPCSFMATNAIIGFIKLPCN